jgi:tetratricopeptide (TPR) repeat protein
MEKLSGQWKIPLVILGAFCCAQSFQPDSLFIPSVESLIVKQNYSVARDLLARYLPSAPDDNYALYLRVAIEQTELLDYESYTLYSERFLTTADSIRKVLENRLDKLSGKDSTSCLFYIANIYGGMGVIKAKNGRWFPALRSSLASIGMLKEVIRRDSTIHAALLGTGAFHYYLSRNFKWLPFISANSETEGIREIEKATAAPLIYRIAAKNSLCWILIDRKQFGRADTVAQSALDEAPGNTIFLRIRCLIALRSGHYDQAVMLGQKLSEISLVRDPVNWSDYVMSYYVLTSSYDGLGRAKEALAAADGILSTKIPPEFMNILPIRKNLKKIQAVKEKYQSQR